MIWLFYIVWNVISKAKIRQISKIKYQVAKISNQVGFTCPDPSKPIPVNQITASNILVIQIQISKVPISRSIQEGSSHPDPSLHGFSHPDPFKKDPVVQITANKIQDHQNSASLVPVIQIHAIRFSLSTFSQALFKLSGSSKQSSSHAEPQKKEYPAI